MITGSTPSAFPNSPRTAPIKLEVGAVIAHRYRLDEQAGAGGMGIVYRAHDLVLDRDVAIKFLNGVQADDDARARLLREARAAAQLKHPNIVAVYDAGTVATEQEPAAPYIVMEMIAGKSLGALKNLTFVEIVDLARAVCDALNEAHSVGIVHRDLKPENILIEQRGDQRIAKLVDFGLAHIRAANQFDESGLVGTVFYIAPEQIQSQPIDGRADLYSLGVVLYELATGHPPFVSQDPVQILSKHLYETPILPSDLRHDIPEALEAIILKLLEKNPADRFASARQVDAALNEVAAQLKHGTAPRTNLNPQLTSFIGREKEIAEIKQRLTAARLVTLVGTGGVGKTRLSIQTGLTLVNEYADGVWLVELAAITDAGLIAQTVAFTLNLREESRRPLIQTLTDHLRDKTLLLILDNCEHLIVACAKFADTLLRACPNLRILATSREALNINGETIYRLPSLALPDAAYLSANDNELAVELLKFDAVRLFVERAIAAAPGFALTTRNARALARVCQRLDGIPLAIELAAARVKALSIEQIATRLDDQFNLLSLGSRAALPRQQTLRALIDWSYNLLAPDERILFNRLTVFVNGWTLEAAETICGDAELDVLTALTQLADKSLVNVSENNDGDARYHFLETIRQYALQKIDRAEEIAALERRHRDWFLRLIEEAEPNLAGGEQVAWLNQLDMDYANILAALDWTLAQHDTKAAMRFGAALWQFWNMRGFWNDGAERLNKILAVDAVPTRERAQTLVGKGILAMYQGDYAAAQLALDEARAIAQSLHATSVWAKATHGLGRIAQDRGDYAQAAQLYHAALDAFQSANDASGVAGALLNLGLLDLYRGEMDGAQKLFTSSLAGFRQIGDKRNIGRVLNNLGLVEYLAEHYANARALYEESLAIDRELRDQAGIANKLDNLGYIALRLGDYAQAHAWFIESVALAHELKNQRLAADVLYGVAATLAALNQPENAAQLIGAADVVVENLGAQIEESNRAEYARCAEMVRVKMSDTAFASARSIGRTLTLAQAIARL